MPDEGSSQGLSLQMPLPKMVLDANIRAKQFDVVIVDEASMASLLYAMQRLLVSLLLQAVPARPTPPIIPRAASIPSASRRLPRICADSVASVSSRVLPAFMVLRLA